MFVSVAAESGATGLSGAFSAGFGAGADGVVVGATLASARGGAGVSTIFGGGTTVAETKTTAPYWGFTSSGSRLLHSGDFYAEWDGSQCLWSGADDMVSEGGSLDILHFDNSASNSINRLKTYSRIRDITQPHWIYWPIPGMTDLYTGS